MPVESLKYYKPLPVEPFRPIKIRKKWENQLGISWAKMYRLGKPLPKIESKVKQCWQKPKLVKTIEKNKTIKIINKHKQFYKCNNMQWVNNLRKY